MQNNFDKLNEIFGVGKTEPEQKPDTAAEPEAPAAGAPAEEAHERMELSQEGFAVEFAPTP